MTVAHQLPPGTPAEPANEPAPGWRTAEGEALRRGFLNDDGTPNVRRFLAFCRRYDVPVYGQGKLQLVVPADVDGALGRVVESTPTREENEHAEAREAAKKHMKATR